MKISEKRLMDTSQVNSNSFTSAYISR